MVAAPDEAGVLVELRAGFHAAAARDATRERIVFFLFSGRLARARAEVVGSVGRNPGLHLLQVLEEHAAIDRQVADDGELGERFQLDGLLQLVDERRARHAGAAVDEHGAGAADLFQAVGVVGHRRGRFTLLGDRVGGDVHQRRGDVHAGTIGQARTPPNRAWSLGHPGA